MITLTALLLVFAQDPAPRAELVQPLSQSPVVATHYFYWYRWPDLHFDQPGAPGPEGHRRHFPDPEQVSYESADWHRKQFEDMAWCGVDVALPVYWGAPGAYERGNLRFSVDGLAPMVEALDAMAHDGVKGVKLGLFYDTSTLLRSVRGLPEDAEHPNRPDLTTPEGKALFCDTVVEYFERIPARHWARFRGSPLVVLYSSGFAGAWDETLGASLAKAFEKRFPGEHPWLVADASWGEIGQAMRTCWGAALSGPKLFPGVAQVGAGYDDTPVPGRRTPIREREDGDFYRWSWRQAVLARPSLVLIETWDEMHEGTEVCETVEAGRRYLELTREWIARLRRNDPGPEVHAPGPLRLRADLSWGEEARGLERVEVDYTASPPARLGLREVHVEDGPCHVEPGALLGGGGPGSAVTYVYFQISDHWAFDVDAHYRVVVTCDGGEGLQLQYDSNDARATLEGAYTGAAGRREETTLTFDLPGARFANRENGGSDFRLVVRGATVAIRGVRAERVPE